MNMLCKFMTRCTRKQENEKKKLQKKTKHQNPTKHLSSLWKKGRRAPGLAADSLDSVDSFFVVVLVVVFFFCLCVFIGIRRVSGWRVAFTSTPDLFGVCVCARACVKM